MSMSWTDVEPARTQGRAVATAVRCAAGTDRAAYDGAVAVLTALPAAPTGALLAAVVRQLVEDTHPGGLDGDDVLQVLTRCLADAATKLPGAAVSPRILVAVLSSALGIHEAGVTYVQLLAPDASRGEAEWVDPQLAGTAGSSSTGVGEQPAPPTTAEYCWHAPLLITSLLGVTGRPLSRYLDSAFADLARAESMEMP